MRVDRSTSASDPDALVNPVVTMGSAFSRDESASGSVLESCNTVSGAYTLKGTFTLMSRAATQTTTA